MTPLERATSSCLEDVRGFHLGHCARRILLLAPRPAEEPAVVLPGQDGRAAAESHRRAMRRLAERGLVELSRKVEEVETKREREAGRVQWDQNAGIYRAARPQRLPVRRSIEKRAVRLTPLGAFVVDRLRPTLETGERIRWASIIDSSPKSD